jgi:hypothetical protein
MRSIAIMCAAVGFILTLIPPVEAAAPGANCRRSSCREGAVCRDLVNKKGLKGAAWTAEFQKCSANPQGYN